MKNFYIHSMGCKSNQFEGSIIKENLVKNGFNEVDEIENADIYILNSDFSKKLLTLASLKQKEGYKIHV